MRIPTSIPGFEIEIEEDVPPLPLSFNPEDAPTEGEKRLLRIAKEEQTKLREHVLRDRGPFVMVRFWVESFLLATLRTSGDDAKRILTILDREEIKRLHEASGT